MKVVEMLDYVAGYDVDGITLTEVGRNAAANILERRADWTDAHAQMLGRIRNGVEKLPMRLRKLTARTRLGDAIELARTLSRDHVRAQKRKARRNAAKARNAA